MDTLRLDLSADSAPMPVDTLEYVGFRRRLGAKAIDMAIHWLVAWVFAFGFGIFVFVAERGAPDSALARMQETTGLGLLLGVLAFITYGAIAEGFHGSTVGKRLLGMVVLKENKKPCGILAAFGRGVSFLFDSLFFGIVAAYGMSTNGRDQRYGDQWFKTVVVKRASAPPEVVRSDLRLVGVLLLAVMADGSVILLHYAILYAG